MPALYSFIVHFSFILGGQPLCLSTTQYQNQFGEPFTVNQCKYYISRIEITGPHGEMQIIFAKSHLVDAVDSASLTLDLTTSLTSITSIRFNIGVDSEANIGGVQTGDLDPMLGMFWTWNTGYIDARLEGVSDSAHAPAHRFTWDVGGYRPGVNATRSVILNLPAVHPNEIGIRADLLHWFDGKHPIRISQSPICHQPGPLAMQLADNYATMFSLAP